MSYCLDSNTLIQAKDEYYGFDFCPGFWNWIEREHAAGHVISIDRVGTELQGKQDQLAVWAKGLPGSFFNATDAAVGAAMARVTTWVTNANYTDHAKRQFFTGADPWLIAYCMSHGHIVTTHEVHIEGERRKVKIPSVCQALGIPCIRTFDMLRALNAEFVLKNV